MLRARWCLTIRPRNLEEKLWLQHIWVRMYEYSMWCYSTLLNVLAGATRFCLSNCAHILWVAGWFLVPLGGDGKDSRNGCDIFTNRVSLVEIGRGTWDTMDWSLSLSPLPCTSTSLRGHFGSSACRRHLRLSRICVFYSSVLWKHFVGMVWEKASARGTKRVRLDKGVKTLYE